MKTLRAFYAGFWGTLPAIVWDAKYGGKEIDRGRYNIGFVTDERRITAPLYKHQGQWVQIPWDDAIALWVKALREAGPEGSGFIGGGRLLNEEAYLLQHVARAFGSSTLSARP